jgi:hypothetical protein
MAGGEDTGKGDYKREIQEYVELCGKQAYYQAKEELFQRRASWPGADNWQSGPIATLV